MTQQEKELENYVKNQEEMAAESKEPKEIKATPINLGHENLGHENLGHETKSPLIKGESNDKNALKDPLGFLQIDLKDLPTKGLFYPDGCALLIRAATAGEIRHWSTMNTDNLSDVYDHLNYILEKCAFLKSPDGSYTWKNIKEMDRMYILFAIRDFTFVEGDNELKMKISETKEIPIRKDNINFIKIPEEVMKFYSATEKCFIFKFKSGKIIKMYLPSILVSSWLKSYMEAKENSQEGYDKDFIQMAPMLIPDSYKLSNRSYENFVLDNANWGIQEVSLISQVYDKFMEQSVPQITYINEAGAEQTAPLSFPEGSLKSIFTVSNIFDRVV